MHRTTLTTAALLLAAAAAPAQPPRRPPPPPTPAPPVARLSGPFGGVTAAQYTQSAVTLAAAQVANELAGLRAEVGRSPAAPPVKARLAALATQATRSAEDFARLAAATPDRSRLDPAHEGMDRTVEALLTAIDQAGAPTNELAQAVARAKYADQQLHLALAGGDAAPDAARRRAVRLAEAAGDQVERLRALIHDLPGTDRTLDRALRAVGARCDRVRRALDAGGTFDEAARDYQQAAADWQRVWAGLAPGPGARPAVRQQAARVDNLLRKLGEQFPAAGPTPPGPAVPGPGFLARGALVVGAGEGGGPRVRVFADARGGQATDFFAYDPGFRGGVRVAVADLNGDGVPDVVTAPGGGMPPLVRVFDGRTLTLTTEFLAYGREWTGGIFVAAADRTRDGKSIVVTGTDAGAGPHVKAFDLAAGKELDSFFAYEESFRGGVRVALGDVDGDGFPDLVTGPGPGGGPAVKVFSGRDRSPLATFFALDEQDRSGLFVAAADVTRDGRAEVIVGSGRGGAGVARVFEAPRGRHLGDVTPYPDRPGVGVRVTAIDFDGNGVPDIVCAPGPEHPGLPVRVYSGRNRASLGEFTPFEPTFAGGAFVGGR